MGANSSVSERAELPITSLTRLLVESPCNTATAQPVSVGLPFAKGVLHDPRTIFLLDAKRRPVPVQTETLALWPDGSVKWLLLDFLVASAQKGCESWVLAHGRTETEWSSSEGLRVEESSHEVIVDTGDMRFCVGRDGFPFSQAFLAGKPVLDGESPRTVVTDRHGDKHTPHLDQVVVEARGPIRATIQCEGTFPGLDPLRVVCRLSFFSGTGLVRLQIAIHNPNRASHRGGLWDLGDSGSVLFRDLSLVLGLNESEKPQVAWAAEASQCPSAFQTGDLEIYQDSSGGENWQNQNHVNRQGHVPCSFQGYRIRSPRQETRGSRANPVVAIQGAHSRLAVAVADFWQQFPKAVEVKDRQLWIRLFPEQFSDLFELQGGEQKTHTIWLDFGAAASSPPPLDWVHQPTRVHAPPEWYAASRAIPHLEPSGTSSDRLEALMTGVVSGDHSLFARREIIDEYGWRHYGEVYADHEAAYYSGPAPIISHYNNQYDVLQGALLQSLRTGDSRWVGLFDPLARHVIDIDIYHTTRDKAAYNGGLFWHTDHYKSAAGCTHRTFSRANCRPGDRSYGGGPSNEHNYTTGLLNYYFLTGDPDARDAVVGLAEWVINMDDGRNNILGILDDGPTGLASSTASREYHGPGRGCGNSVNALIDAWLLTRCRAYLEKAESLIRRSVHPNDDVDARDLLNVESRWSYTVFLSVLARYLQLKAEAGELDFMYAYASATLLRYAGWMLDHEVPYFDHPEKLEYPTETWAAQELRKANVLRLAAAYADEPIRSSLLRRGHDLAERAWSDLLRFPSHTMARPVAILMTEGVRDRYFRTHEVQGAPRSPVQHEFGTPESFVPQRLRVFKQLRTIRGFVRATLRLVNVMSWWSWPTRRRESRRLPPAHNGSSQAPR
jgi:hypothetical protein